jgi:zinc protease
MSFGPVTRIVAACAALFIFGAAAAQSQPPALDIPVPEIPYTKFVLPNGLTLLVHEDHKTPVVAVNTWYHVGSKNEKPGKTGFAHLFEHLMFSGSENLNQVYLTAMGRIGATGLNGTTSNDRTNYFQNVPTSMLDYVLFAESDRMGHLLGVLDQKKLDLQRGVVQNEKRQRENEPYGVAYELLVQNTYPPGHPYSWTIIGSMKDLDAASMTDVQEWFKTNYGPNNVTLVLAGDITPEVARQKVEKYYGAIPAGPPLAKQGAWVAKRTGTHRARVEDRVPQSRLYRVWNVPQFGTREEALLDVAAQILGGGKTSRLYKRLVYKDQIAITATAENDANEIGGQFDFTLTAKPGVDLRKVELAADEELRDFLRNGPTEAELQLAKTKLLANHVRTVERVGGFGGKSDLLARCQTFVGKPDCYREGLAWIRGANAAAVKKAVNDWLSDGDFLLEVQPYPTHLTTTAKLDRSTPPALGGSEKLSLPPMQRTTLANGLKVVVVERHNAPIVNFSLLVRSGYSTDSAELPGVASFAQRMLEEGTPTRNSLRISEELEALGATFGAGANLDWVSANLNVLKATMPQGLAIFADIVLHPAFPASEFERVRATRVAGIAREKVTPNAMALRVVPGLLYGKGHPYALPFTGTGSEAALAKMTRDDLARFHQTWFKPNNATLLVVGDTTLAEIKPRLESLFAQWQPAPVPAKTVPIVAQPEKTAVYLVDRPGALQSVIFGAQLAPPRNDPDAVAMQVVNNIFGGSFASRINMNLREDKHWSYGVFSALPDARGQRPYLTISPVQTDKTREALGELVNEYSGIAGARPIDARELERAQSEDTLKLPGSFETAGQLASAYSTILQYDLPEDYYNTFTQKTLALTADQANALAKRIVQPGKLIWVVVGDLARIEPGIRELNLGEVRKIDADGNPAS